MGIFKTRFKKKEINFIPVAFHREERGKAHFDSVGAEFLTGN